MDATRKVILAVEVRWLRLEGKITDGQRKRRRCETLRRLHVSTPGSALKLLDKMALARSHRNGDGPLVECARVTGSLVPPPTRGCGRIGR